MRLVARPVRAGKLASVFDAEAWQGDALVAVARALFSAVAPQQGVMHRFD